MNFHLVEIATQVTPGAVAALLMDQAGWHMSSYLVVPPKNEDDNCRKAKFVVTDLIGRAKLRSGLRRQVLRSTLFHSERFALCFEYLMYYRG